jgi:uncharacterized membrane protein
MMKSVPLPWDPIQFRLSRDALLNVLWALGWAMIVLSALVHLPARVVTAFGILLIVGHNLFDSAESSSVIWSILTRPISS